MAQSENFQIASYLVIYIRIYCKLVGLKGRKADGIGLDDGNADVIRSIFGITALRRSFCQAPGTILIRIKSQG